MFKLFKNQKAEKPYSVIICAENDPTTKMVEHATCKTYEEADRKIRRQWGKKETDRIGNGYKVNDCWVLIEKKS